MVCRSCGNEERASEGYPCVDCGTFICVICDMRGITRCRSCQAKRDAGAPMPGAPMPGMPATGALAPAVKPLP